jgi:hypothetical protein
MPEPNQSSMPPGQRPAAGEGPPVLGDFEILERIGQGAMGAVFRARQRSMDRLVAVKVLKPSLAGDKAYVERFWHEARAAARLHHPNIVLAINAGEDHGLYYFAMEYVEGHSVGLLLKAGPLEERRALEIALQVARALDYAWSQERIVHRDIKPGNIIITPEGTAKLADLGLAHEVALDETDEFTAEGKVVGTPFYIAPEQILRRADLDVRCDLYALGASLFHMLTGRPPYEGSDAKAVLAKHLHEPVPDPRRVRPELSEGAARIVTKLLAKDRDGRYPDATALAADIEAITKGEAAPARPAPAVRVRRVAARGPRLSSANIVVFVVLLFILGAVLLSVLRASKPTTTDEQKGTQQPDTSLAADARNRAAGAALKEAEAFAAGQPGAFDAAIERLRAVEARFPETPSARRAADARARLEAQLGKKAKETLDALARQAGSLIAERKYADALALLDRFPKELAAETWRGPLAAARAAIEKKARSAFETALVPGDDAVEAGKFDDALAAYEAVRADSALPSAWREQVAERIAAAQRRQQEAAERARAEKEAAHVRLLADVLALQRERKYDEAAELLKGRLAAADPERRDELTLELGETTALRQFWSRVERGAGLLVGQTYSIRGIQGTVASVKEGRLTIRTPGGLFSQELKALSADDVLRLATGDLAPAAREPIAGDGRLAAARFFAAEGNIEAASARLKALEDSGSDVAAHRARLQRIAAIAVLVTAGKELRQARDLLAAGNPEAATAALRSFLERYEGQTVAPDLCAEARRLLKEAAAPKTALALPARLRVACDGGYKVFLNGEPVASGKTADGQFAEADLRVKEGDLLAIEATSQSGSPSPAMGACGLYALLDVQGGRYAIPTDTSWRWHADPREGWQGAAEPQGKWQAAAPAYSVHVKPGYAKADPTLPGYWIWGKGQRVGFRKLLRLQKTVAAQQADERTLQQALTAKHGPPSKATLWLACRDAHLVYLNGRLAGAAASFLPQGASFDLLVRHGDVLAVQAVGAPKEGWLDAKLTVADVPTPIRTDRTWVYTTGQPPDDWQGRGAPGGLWRSPEFSEPASHRIWGDEPPLFFRKTIDLKARPEGATYFHGRTRMLARRRVELTYDFRDPEQLADWHCEGTWGWSKGKVGGSSGGLFSLPFNTQDIQVEAAADTDSPLIIGIWGDEASRGAGITLNLNFPDRYVLTLRSGRRTIATGRLPGGFETEAHRFLLRKDADRVSVSVDGREVLSGSVFEGGRWGHLWRVGFMAGGGEKAAVGSARILGDPDWRQLEADERQRAAEPQPQPPR